MEQQPEKSKPGWLNRFEVLLIGATAILSGLVSLLDFLGFLDGIPWLSERIPTLTLLATGLVAAYLVLERRNQLEGMQRETARDIEKLSQALSQSTVTVIESLEGLELRKFENANDMMPYVSKRLLQARQQIDDLSWSPALGLEYGLNATQELEAEYAERIARVSRKIPYREVFSFNRPGRIEKLKMRLQENTPGYSCAYYEDIQAPVLQFMIIDNDEVLILSDQFQSKLAIKHPYVVKLFAEYYEEIWRRATPIKIGTSTEKAIVQRILNEKSPSQNGG